MLLPVRAVSPVVRPRCPQCHCFVRLDAGTCSACGLPFALPIYGSNVLHINLSFFDSIAAICRWAITILLTSLGIMQVVRWYRGV